MRRIVRAGVTIAAALFMTVGITPWSSVHSLSFAQAEDSPRIAKAEWLSDRHVKMWIHSPAMGAEVPVHLLLARSWFAEPKRTFPLVYLLDSMKAGDDDNGWLKNTRVEEFYTDKDVNVVAPVGGESSFYSDWLESDNGKSYKWESFLLHELPPLLEQNWRSSDQRGVIGASMGGTGAMTLAARNPGFFRVIASLSGILQTTSIGMPQAIDYAMKEAGGYDSKKMWGEPTNPEWAEHDPYLKAEKLRGSSIYISSGNGVGATAAAAVSEALSKEGAEPEEIASGVTGSALELLSRLSSQSFAAKLAQLGIPAEVIYRPSGTHSWPYWEFENTQLWPQMAMGLGVSSEAVNCQAGGAIGEYVAEHEELGQCVTPEFDIPGGKEQDFNGGRVFWSESGGAQGLGGMINAQYASSGGPAGPLGLPVSEEGDTSEGIGKYARFTHGAIYWTPEGGAHAVMGEIFKTWGEAGFEGGPTGYPENSEHLTPGGSGIVQTFQHGLWYWSEPTGAHPVGGSILDKYAQLGYENSVLGFPVSEEIALQEGGRVQKFAGGSIYWRPDLGAVLVSQGPIMSEWAAHDYERGPYGYPVEDQSAPSQGIHQLFEHCIVTVEDGNIRVDPR